LSNSVATGWSGDGWRSHCSTGVVSTSHTPIRIPVASYRLQFNSRFTFRDALATVEYLDRLCISDCYASSYLRAVPGSGHGYDVADPTRLNPEIGTEDEYASWLGALTAHGMSHILDLVPNHMGIAKSANPWWMDVLENGPSSRFARFFDIEWRPVKDELADKVLIPILGDQYGVVLEAQQLKLAYRGGAFEVEYYDDWLPIAPDSFTLIIRRGLEALDARGETIDEQTREELHSVATAAANLPPRSTRDAGLIAERARDKEMLKRRIAALTDRSDAARAFVDATLGRFNGVAGQPRSFDWLDELLNAQSYRLANWRVASEEINYRRFFDINQLAAVRMEDPEVFDEVHRFAFELVARRAATGLRVDHVDGLFSPADYLRRLQLRAAEALGTGAGPDSRSIFLVVEKILGADEGLPAEWPVHGTTGYEFSFVVNNLFVDGRNERAFDDIYRRFSRARVSFDDLGYASKKTVMHATMSGDINSLGHQLNRFSERNRHFRDFTLYSLISTLKEVIACFPVYRTYITGAEPVSEHDRRFINRAVRSAKRRAPHITGLVFDFVERLLLKQTPASAPEESEERERFIGKFQQITSPVAAKGIEDTALYNYNRLLSLNEVGADPTRFGYDPSVVHRWLSERRRQWPLALSATATHDTKRGEDVRARLNVLSELPRAWKEAVTKWRALNRRLKTDVNGTLAPDANEEYLIYQTLVGAWPFDDEGAPPLGERLAAYLTKAMREAKANTSWLAPNEEHEAAVLRFAAAILDSRRPFLQAFRPFQEKVADLGIYNSLAQLLIKITAPGIPDFYQGTELWDLSLVDPDNRRPVDYERRRALLAEVSGQNRTELVSALVDRRTDGRIKLFTMLAGLQVRNEMRAVFEEGDYVPLETGGASRHHLFAFARQQGDRVAVTCVPRLVATLMGDRRGPPLGPDVWDDTRVTLPGSSGARGYRNVLTGATLTAGGAAEDGGATLKAADVFDRFPVALLVADGG
jgi:(1->4)-alpha-D-glucan 1-alpha-D-glucosylmutase